jgi:aspartate aminotransferase
VAIITRAQQMKAEGIDVVSFGAGEPDFDTPQFIKDAAKAALDAGDTKYNPRKLKALKQAICDKLARDNAVTASPDQVAVTFGGKHALYDAFQVLLNPGDKVLIPAPYWVSYPEQVKLAGGVPVAMPTRAESGFKITPRQVLDLAGDAKIIVLNSPSNPTGVTYTRDELAALAEAILKTGLAVFSDEIYENLVYGDTKFCSMAAVEPRLADRLIIFNGLAKAFSMTGWRLGWAVGPKDVIGAIDRLMSHETTNPVSFAVAGAYEAYTNPQSPRGHRGHAGGVRDPRKASPRPAHCPARRHLRRADRRVLLLPGYQPPFRPDHRRRESRQLDDLRPGLPGRRPRGPCARRRLRRGPLRPTELRNKHGRDRQGA